MNHPAYESAIHDPQQLTAVAQKVGEWCLEHKVKHLVCCGASGVSVCAVASALYDLSLIIVRKEHEKCSTPRTIQGPDCNIMGDYVIVDDLIETGRTADRMMLLMHQQEPDAKLRAILLYEYSTHDTFRGVPCIKIGERRNNYVIDRSIECC